MNKFVSHLKTVLNHKKWVFYYCCKAGIPYRGLVHDLSKFSPTEFLESVKYYQGDRSPIDACKEANGVSMAWQHHKGRNSHHYEYWTDYYDKNYTDENAKTCVAHKMPFLDALEMMCDYMGAGRAYTANQNKPFKYEDELKWWENKISKPVAMHEQTKLFCDMMFKQMVKDNSDECLKFQNAKAIYDKAERMCKWYDKKNK